MDGWARMADAAHQATTFEELRAAGAEFGKVLGEDAARAMILAVATLTRAHAGAGGGAGEVAAGLPPGGSAVEGPGRARPPWRRAGRRRRRWRGGGAGPGGGGGGDGGHLSAGPPGRGDAQEGAGPWGGNGPRGPLLRNRPAAPGRQPAGGTRRRPALAPATGQVGGGHPRRGQGGRHAPGGRHPRPRRSGGPTGSVNSEKAAIRDAEKQGEYWLARLLEREARGRFVHDQVETAVRADSSVQPARAST